MSSTEPSTAAETTSGIEMETHIAASPATVWRALTDNIGDWWPAEFFIGGEAGKRRYVLEATPGGRVYEEWDDGGGMLWGQVWTVMPEKLLQVSGHTFPDWGGPLVSFLSYRLEATDGGCTLRFSERILGHSTDANNADRKKGWTYLYAEVLKAHVEGRPIPQWQD